jgi:hypothetical protein
MKRAASQYIRKEKPKDWNTRINLTGPFLGKLWWRRMGGDRNNIRLVNVE